MNHGRQTGRAGGYREMAGIATPLILGMASYTVMQFCDRVFLSRFSNIAIQAALPAGILAHNLVCFFQSLAGFAGTFTAQYHGANRPREGLHAVIQGLWISLLSWPVILIQIPLGFWLMTVSGHSPEVLAAEKTYFLILMAGGPMVAFNAAIGGYFIGIGKTAVNGVANVIGCSLNILLNYIMIFGHLGCPALGIAGAAYATLISGLATVILQLLVLLREPVFRETLREEGARLWGIKPKLLKRIFAFGTPSGLQVVMDIGSFTVFILLTGRLGDLAMAASNIALSVNNLAFAPLLGFGMATSTVVSQYMGARNPDAANRAGYTGMKLGMLYMLAIGSTFVLFPRGYFALFSPANAPFTADELLRVGRIMLYLMAGWGLLDTMNIIFSYALKGAGDTRFVMIYITLTGWLILVPGTLLLYRLGADIIQLWIWMALFIGIVALGFLWRWRQGKWRTIQMIEYLPDRQGLYEATDPRP